MKRLLLASVLLLPMLLPAQAAQCTDGDGSFYDCWRDGTITFYFDDLTPSERDAIAAIRESADARLVAEINRSIKQAEANEKRERVRISQCTIPFLGIGCPAK